MVFHNKTTGHRIPGEAAINLAFEEQEITVVSLIRQLSEMAEKERSDERVAQIALAQRFYRHLNTRPRRIKLAGRDRTGTRFP